MQIIEITDTFSKETEAYFHLTDAQMRSRQEPEKGIFIAEGPKVVGTALAEGFNPLSFLIRRKFLETEQGLELLRNAGNVPVFTAEDDVLAALTGFRLQRSWILSAMHRRPELKQENVLDKAQRIAVLEGITEPSNVGSIFRSAAALNVDGILLSPNCCDPYHRRSVRVCMGAIFRIPWARTDSLLAVPELKARKFSCIGLALKPESIPLDDPSFSDLDRTALFLGTEDTGLCPETIARMDRLAVIPMAEGIDSLNVGCAAAIAFWRFRKRNKE